MRTRRLTLLDCWRATRAYCVPFAGRLSPQTRWKLFRQLLYNRRMGPSTAIEHEGRLLAVAGLVSGIPGVAEAWSVHLPGAKNHPLRFVRCCRRWLARQIPNYHRVQACVADAPQLHQFCHVLGFQAETRLLKADAEAGPVYVYAIWPREVI
jgi:hypothetical protein